MNENEKPLDELLETVTRLLKKQEEMSAEMLSLSREMEAARTEIVRLKYGNVPKLKNAPPAPEKIAGEKEKVVVHPYTPPPPPKYGTSTSSPVHESKQKGEAVRSDLEKFIGENLINKIGILVLIVGVAIGAKYSIEHNLISPLTRIILGYLMGLGLLATGIALRARYENLSAVIVSGGMAVFYFITFFAYEQYELIAQTTAFVLMVLFTVFTVIISVLYNNQVIAHIGLVAAYAVPFLLSDGSGRVVVLFSYVAIINSGILILSFIRYWKPLFYVSFALTWLIYASWFFTSYSATQHLAPALIFGLIFLLIFHTSFLAFKTRKGETFGIEHVLILLLNAFIFFGFGYAAIEQNDLLSRYNGLFTAGNAVIHFVTAVILYRRKDSDLNLFYLAAGLVIVFVTIAIPVQLDGNWVTLSWAGEAVVLFTIGIRRNIRPYGQVGHILAILTFCSLMHDWSTGYIITDAESGQRLTPLLNQLFLTSMLVVAALAAIFMQSRQKPAIETFGNNDLNSIAQFAVPVILLLSVYGAFRYEIHYYWSLLLNDSAITLTPEGGEYPERHYNGDYNSFRVLSLQCYTLFMLTILAFLATRIYRNIALTTSGASLLVFTVLIFLGQGLYEISELRGRYIGQSADSLFDYGTINLYVRYICFLFLTAAIYGLWQYQKQWTEQYRLLIDLFTHLTVLWVLSSELIHWLDLAGVADSWKLGLTILWGVYSLAVIVLGIWKKRKYLRVAAISLFAVTLGKLVLYDMQDMGTLSRTVVFVSLGVLLLVTSFLYNKYKNLISDETAA